MDLSEALSDDENPNVTTLGFSDDYSLCAFSKYYHLVRILLA